jgi:putative transposase
LKGVAIERVNQVWSADITSVPMPTGFMYLAATIDWFSRLVISWRLSNSLERDFCLAMLEESLSRGKPGIFNTDQGVQFTASAWTDRLESVGIQVRMAGVGRCHDNILMERLWRSVKSEDIYPKGYASVAELQAGLRAYFRWYNEERPHQRLGYKTPAQVHEGG